MKDFRSDAGCVGAAAFDRLVGKSSSDGSADGGPDLPKLHARGLVRAGGRLGIFEASSA